MPPDLSIVIVSYNTQSLLRRAISSIATNRSLRVTPPSGEASGPPLDPRAVERPPAETLSCQVVVVDNASHDGSAEMVGREFPQVRLIPSGGNLGFARATNLGLRESQGDLLLLLNPDTEIVGDALRHMAGYLRSHPGVAAVGPRLVYPDGGLQHSAFRFPTLWMSLFDFFPINHRFIDSRLNGRYRPSRGDAPFPIDHPLGAALMMRRDALKDVGPLDEGFFMYCEEVDWCLRARQLGWEIYQLPYAKIIHHEAQSSRQLREDMLVELHRSRYRLFRKHYSPGFVRAHRAITRAGVLRDALLARWQRTRGEIVPEQLRRRLRAYRIIWGM